MKKSQKLSVEHFKVSSSLSLHKAINSRVENYSHQLLSYFDSVSELEVEKVRMQEAATFIQKHIRGYLTRVKFSDDLIGMQKKVYLNNSVELEKNSEFCLYSVGRNIHRASKIIQRAVRRFLFRKKVSRFQMYYESVLAKREEMKLKKLVSLSFVYFSKFQLSFQRFLRNRERKLKKIRRKLAVLKIKGVVLREKISIKNIRAQIKKYKRRITLSLGGMKLAKVDDNGMEEDLQSNISELERLAKMKLAIELEDARRAKIKLGKISYKIPKLKYLNVVPRIKPKSSSSSESGSEVYKVNEKQQKYTTPEPIAKPKIDRFRHIKSNYMGKTLSFENRVNGPKWYFEKPEALLPKAKRRLNTLYSPTQFSVQKIKEKRAYCKSDKPSWNISPLVTESYTPSIFSHKEQVFLSDSFEMKTKKYTSRMPDNKIHETAKGYKTIYDRRIKDEPAIQQVSYRFEEALPELARISKRYSQKAEGVSTRKNTSAFQSSGQTYYAINYKP